MTNPTENSFRSYLTEQSFRHHLSRLDCNADDQASTVVNRSRLPRNTSSSATASLFSVENPTPFHFANRTSIALRTPKHIFHSFAIFTIAAMAPLSKSSEADNRDGCMISDSWYIGAFGKWWRGGVLEAWYQDVIARTKDEESWSSGILSIKRLDIFPEYNGMWFIILFFFSTSRFFPFRTHLLTKEPAGSFCTRTPTQVKKSRTTNAAAQCNSGTTKLHPSTPPEIGLAPHAHDAKAIVRRGPQHV